MNREKLVEKRVALIKEIDELMKGKEQLTEDESTRYDELETQVKEIDKSIQRADDLEELKSNIPGPAPIKETPADIKTFDRYSISEAILKHADKNEVFDGVYAEMHQEGVKENQSAGVGTKAYKGFLVPTVLHSRNVVNEAKSKLKDPNLPLQQRATLQATVDAAGGYTVETELGALIESLRNSMVTMQAGMTVLSGLQGDVDLPRRTTDSIAYWRSEGGVATQADPVYDKLTLSPERLTAFTRFSRQLLRQQSFSTDAEVRDTLTYAQANELETTAFDGSGSSNQPEGIFNNSSVNNADHGSNGTLINWANITNMEGMVATDNALMGRLQYITNSTMGAYMKTLVKTTNQGGFLWENFTPLAGGTGMVNGYQASITNVLSNALTKGTGTGLSPIIFGDWSQLVMGQWGAQEFIVDPFTRLVYDEINVLVVGYFDYVIRHPEGFSTIEAGRTS